MKKKLSVNVNRHAKFLGKVGEIDAFSTHSLFLGGQTVHQDVSKLHYIDFPNTLALKLILLNTVESGEQQAFLPAKRILSMLNVALLLFIPFML